MPSGDGEEGMLNVDNIEPKGDLGITSGASLGSTRSCCGRDATSFLSASVFFPESLRLRSCMRFSRDSVVAAASRVYLLIRV